MKSIRMGLIATTLAFLMLFLTSGCATLFQGKVAPEDVPMATYGSARAGFNYYVEEYLTYRATITDPADMKATREKFESKFWDARKALDAWGRVVEAGDDPTEKASAYNAIFSTLLHELLSRGIVKPKKPGS